MLIMLCKNTRNNILIGGMRVCARDERLNESIQRERRYSQIRDYLMTCICHVTAKFCKSKINSLSLSLSLSFFLSFFLYILQHPLARITCRLIASLSLPLSLVYKSLTSFSIPANKKMFKYIHSLRTHLQILIMLINKYKACAINTVNQ